MLVLLSALLIGALVLCVTFTVVIVLVIKEMIKED